MDTKQKLLLLALSKRARESFPGQTARIGAVGKEDCCRIVGVSEAMIADLECQGLISLADGFVSITPGALETYGLSTDEVSVLHKIQTSEMAVTNQTDFFPKGVERLRRKMDHVSLGTTPQIIDSLCEKGVLSKKTDGSVFLTPEGKLVIAF